MESHQKNNYIVHLGRREIVTAIRELLSMAPLLSKYLFKLQREKIHFCHVGLHSMFNPNGHVVMHILFILCAVVCFVLTTEADRIDGEACDTLNLFLSIQCSGSTQDIKTIPKCF